MLKEIASAYRMLSSHLWADQEVLEASSLILKINRSGLPGTVCEGQPGISYAEVLSALPIKITTDSLSKFPHLVLTIYSCLSNSQVVQEASYSETGRWPAYSKQATKLPFCASQEAARCLQPEDHSKNTSPAASQTHRWPALFTQNNSLILQSYHKGTKTRKNL